MERGGILRINIYYGGRGLIEDPTIYVMEKVIEVLKELRVDVVRYNLYEDRNAIATLPSTLKEADGVILACSLEWYGFGGLMQQFLDMCWLYGDKSKIASLYMLPVVIATTYGEKDASNSLIKAWETLGGLVAPGISAYVENHVEFENNEDYLKIIEKSAENLYRFVNQKLPNLPSSNRAVRDNLSHTKTIELTPQESERLSRFVSDDGYVQRQKQDIEDLSAMFKQMLGEEAKSKEAEEPDEIITEFMKNFYPEKDFEAKYVLMIPDQKKNLIIQVSSTTVDCYYGPEIEADVTMRVSLKMLRAILAGKETFQKGFMAGEITAKGNFKNLRMLDQVFRFRYKK